MAGFHCCSMGVFEKCNREAKEGCMYRDPKARPAEKDLVFNYELFLTLQKSQKHEKSSTDSLIFMECFFCAFA